MSENNGKTTLQVTVSESMAAAFQEYIERRHSTAETALHHFIHNAVARDQAKQQARNEDVHNPIGCPHVVSYQNTDRLKAEVAHHNPDGLNPDAMLNRILDRYFELAEQVRR